jgi:hypothetical protein
MDEFDWFTKDRSETSANRMPDRTLPNNPNVTVSNKALGINVYSGALTREQGKKYIDVLERKLSSGQGMLRWQGAKVTTSAEVTESARNALDFKMNSMSLGPRTEENAEMYDMHEEIFRAVKSCVDDYGQYWGVGICSYEAFNFVKYDGPGTHFKIHADHGPTYVCTISVLVYLNDEFEGGETYFPRMDGLAIKPKAGDIAVFPSTYIYEHASQDMISGVKYAVVIMTDYNDRGDVNHKVSPIIEEYKLKY